LKKKKRTTLASHDHRQSERDPPRIKHTKKERMRNKW